MNLEQIGVMELEGFSRPTCNKLHESKNDASRPSQVWSAISTVDEMEEKNHTTKTQLDSFIRFDRTLACDRQGRMAMAYRPTAVA